MPATKIRDSEFFYTQKNTDKTECVLLIHGHPFNHSMWSYQFEALKEFQLIAPDLKGYGKSAVGIGQIFIEEQALDLAMLLDQLEIEKVHLVGLSMGAQVALEFARLFRHRTKSLVFCDSTSQGETNESQVHPRELILRSMQDWSSIQTSLNVLESEGKIVTRQLDTFQIAITEQGLELCKSHFQK